MNIGIIGTGNMARNLAIGWLKVGHQVQIGSRQPDARASFLEQVAGASIDTFAAVLAQCETIVIAIPYTAVESFARQYADALREKLVIDISNPFGNLPDNRISGPEVTAGAIGDGARVVAAFKATFWETLLQPIDPRTEMPRDVFYVGDDANDKEIVASLIADLGFRPVDCGALRNSRILDGMVPLMLELDQRYGKGEHRMSWKLMG